VELKQKHVWNAWNATLVYCMISHGQTWNDGVKLQVVSMLAESDEAESNLVVSGVCEADSEAESGDVDDDAKSDGYVTWSVIETCVADSEAESSGHQTWYVKKTCCCLKETLFHQRCVNHMRGNMNLENGPCDAFLKSETCPPS
jgi:hypothetical protein